MDGPHRSKYAGLGHLACRSVDCRGRENLVAFHRCLRKRGYGHFGPLRCSLRRTCEAGDSRQSSGIPLARAGTPEYFARLGHSGGGGRLRAATAGIHNGGPQALRLHPGSLQTPRETRQSRPCRKLTRSAAGLELRVAMSALISLLLVLAPACGALCRPEDKQPWLEQSKLHFARVEKSRQAALMVLQAEPSDATALMSLLESQLLLRQRTEARLSTQKLTRLLSPRDPRYFRVASLLAAHQDYVAAIPLMENVQREFPQSYEVNFNLALAFFDTQANRKPRRHFGRWSA